MTMGICDYCKREFPGTYYETELVSYLTLGLVHDEKHDFEEKESSECCIDCHREIKQFTKHIDEIERSAHPHNHEFSVRSSVSGCSVCGDGIGKLYGFLMIIDFPSGNDRPRNYVSCRSCYNVISNFLDNIPENNYSGETFYCPAEFGWRAHQYLRSLTIEQLHHCDLVRMERAIQNTHMSEKVRRHMFQTLISEVANKGGKGSKVPVHLDIGLGGVPIKWSIEILQDIEIEEPRVTNFGDLSNYHETSILLLCPTEMPQRIGDFTELIRPQMQQLKTFIALEYDNTISQTESALADLEKNEPDKLEMIEKYEIADIIREIGDKVSMDPRRWKNG